LSRETYFAIADEARTLDIPFAGHVPVNPDGVGFAVSGIEASNAGQKSFEHLFGIPFSTDDRSMPELISTLKRNHTWVCPTLRVLWNRAHINELKAGNDPRLKLIALSLRSFWDGQVRGFSPDTTIPTKLLAWRTAGVNFLFDAEIPLLAGTDLGFPYVFPGDLSKELELLVDIGLPPAAVLRTATINPAKYMGHEDEMGSIDVGKIADAVLLDANPLEDIRAVERVHAVLFNGRYLEHDQLQKARILK
jgi:imidazolonepropionase-like amidohydrolase